MCKIDWNAVPCQTPHPDTPLEISEIEQGMSRRSLPQDWHTHLPQKRSQPLSFSPCLFLMGFFSYLSSHLLFDLYNTLIYEVY